jgi:HK97 family phage major capsid protein
MDLKKLLEMKAKREDSRLKAMAVLNKAEAEKRFLTDEEQKELDGYETEIKNWDESIKRAEKFLTMEPAPKPTEQPEVKTNPSEDTRNFASFGEQMVAVYRSACPGGKMDTRLSARAATGLNETNPSDGGFLLQQDFVK